MPSAQVIDRNPLPRTQETTLEKTLGSFIDSYKERGRMDQESDALKQIYGQYQQDEQNILGALEQLSTNPNIGPTRRVEETNKLMAFHKQNQQLQQDAQKRAQELQQNQSVISGLERDRGLSPGSLSAYASNPSLANQISKPQQAPRTNQADRPIDPEQQENIQKAVQDTYWEKATIPQKQRLLERYNVSASNQRTVLDPIEAQQKLDFKENQSERKYQYDVHKDTQKIDEEISKAAKGAKNQLEAIKDTRKALNSGNTSPLSLANIFKGFGDIGNKISAGLINKDEAVIQASIPAFLEGRKELFGVRLSDADLRLLQDKLPDIGKSKSANESILNIMERAGNLSVLKSKISNEIKKQNKGLRPIDFTEQVEERFDDLSSPIELISPRGNKIEVPKFQVEDAIKAGAKMPSTQEQNYEF